MDNLKIKKNLIQSQGQLFSNYIYTFAIDPQQNQMHPSDLLPYQIEANKGHQAYLNGFDNTLEIFKQALKIEENYFTVMNLCVIYLLQRNFQELDELINKASILADGQIHHILFLAEMNLLIHDYDKAIIQLGQLFNDPDQYEVVEMILKQIFINKLYSKQHLSNLISDNNILQKIIKINKNIFTKGEKTQFQSFETDYSKKSKDSVKQSILSNDSNTKTFMQLNLSKQSSIQDQLSKQSSIQNQLSKQSSVQSAITKTLSYVTDKTDQLSFISTSNSTAITSNGSLIDFSFIDIILENPDLFSFQFRIPYMIGSYDIREMNKLDQKIAEGGFGAVYVSKHLKTNEIHAVKVIKEQDDQDVNLILQEIIIQHQIQNLNPLLFLNLKPQVYLKKQNKLVDIYIPLELAQFSLFDYLKEVQVDEEEYIEFYNLFIDFIVTLHKNQFAHRDIKPQNILYIKDVGWKLADFGESIKYNEVDSLYKIRGTLAFLPQKLRRLQKQQKDAKQNLLYNDVYAIVCTLQLIKNPSLNSKELTDIMDSNQFDELQQLLLRNFNDINMLNQLKIPQIRNVQTKIIIKQQIQEQQSSWDCLERFNFCLDQQLPLEDDLIQKLDELLGGFEQKGQINQLILYTILISSAFPFQLDRFQNIPYFNFNRLLAVRVVAESYGYYRQIIRYLTIIKHYDFSIFICDTIMNNEYEIFAHLFKIETLRLYDKIIDAKQELELAYRYLLQVQSYTLDEQIFFVELYQKLHNEVPQIKVDKALQQHLTKINQQDKIQQTYHQIDDESLIPINVNRINEKQHLQIRLDVLLRKVQNFPQKLQYMLYQNILHQFGNQFFIDDQLANIEELIKYIKENLIFWNTVYHQKIHLIAIGLSQIFSYYGKYHVAQSIGLYFHKILMNYGSWKSIFCHFEELFHNQLMVYVIYDEYPQFYFDIDACLLEAKYLSLYDNVQLRLWVCNYLFNLFNNFKFSKFNELQLEFAQRDVKSFILEGIDFLKNFLLLKETTDPQRQVLKIYLEKLLMSILNHLNIDWVNMLQVIKKINNIQFNQNGKITTFENYSISQLDIAKQHKIVSQLYRKILLSQNQINSNSIKLHIYYYKTISKIYDSPLKVLNHQRMLGMHYVKSIFVSQDDKFNTDIRYILSCHKYYKHNKISQEMQKRIDQINIFKQSFCFYNFMQLLKKFQGKQCKVCQKNKVRTQKRKINFIGYPNMEFKLCMIIQKYNLRLDMGYQNISAYFFLYFDDLICLDCWNFLQDYLVICQTCQIVMMIRKNNMFDFEFEVNCHNCFRKFCRQCNQFRELYQSDGENNHRICFFKNFYYCSKTNIIINILDYLRFIQLLLINSLALSYNIINQYSRFWSKTYKLFRCTLLLLFYFPLSFILLIFLILAGTLGFIYSIRYRYDFKYLALQLIDEEYYLDYIL